MCYSKDTCSVTLKYKWVTVSEKADVASSIHLKKWSADEVRVEWTFGPYFDGLESDQISAVNNYYHIAV